MDTSDSPDSCRHKERYDSPDLARRVARRRPRRAAYKCTVCHGWHVGGVAPGRLRRPRRGR